MDLVDFDSHANHSDQPNEPEGDVDQQTVQVKTESAGRLHSLMRSLTLVTGLTSGIAGTGEHVTVSAESNTTQQFAVDAQKKIDDAQTRKDEAEKSRIFKEVAAFEASLKAAAQAMRKIRMYPENPPAGSHVALLFRVERLEREYMQFSRSFMNERRLNVEALFKLFENNPEFRGALFEGLPNVAKEFAELEARRNAVRPLRAQLDQLHAKERKAFIARLAPFGSCTVNGDRLIITLNGNPSSVASECLSRFTRQSMPSDNADAGSSASCSYDGERRLTIDTSPELFLPPGTRGAAYRDFIVNALSDIRRMDGPRP